ncbi:MAG TPA: PD-(D/E)XK nuclease family protein [Burkholderiales bacterium]|nr:PD-(D/E)XK nuclease family protein [Burkholderiales bacterium]
MPGETAAIPKQELFARLAGGHAAAITVVTPNRRLSQVLKAEFDDFQTGRGQTVWEDTDILPWDAWLGRGYEEATYSDGEPLPMLLSEAQERALWEEAIRASRWAGALLDVPQTASAAQDAWRLAHAWGLEGALGKGGGEDARAFADWARAYAARCARDGLTDAARLLQLLKHAAFKRPKLLVAYAFDVLPVRVGEFFEFLSSKEIPVLRSGPEKSHGNEIKRTSYPSPREELEAAARWARARVEEGKRRIGVVVPELAQRRREAVRVFSRAMHPGFNLPAAKAAPLPFDVSLGEPLADFALVAAALSILEFSFSEKSFEEVSRLVRSPFLRDADSGVAARAKLDARLRRDAPGALSLPKLIGLLDKGNELRGVLESILNVSRALERKTQALHGWARHFTALLDAAGFPGERTLDSAEYQARTKFNEVLGELSRLSLVRGEAGIEEALSELRRLCSELYQVESPGVPVHVLELREAAGQEFDALWVSGMTDGAWPLAPRPSPFLPVALQRQAGIPEASAEASLALDRLRTEHWMRAAPEVVFSWPRREQDRDLVPSPLIMGIGEKEVVLPLSGSYRDLIFSQGKTESLEDQKAPALEAAKTTGGTRLLADQAACPFRAFARHRLAARALEEPAEGLDAQDRGKLLHALMAAIWRQVKTSRSLAEDLNPVIEKSAAHAVRELGLEGRLAEIEKARLARLARDWLEVESRRPAFEVVEAEQEHVLHAGPLALKGRIDRVDKLADGTLAVIDYKTGVRVTPKDWEGPRADDPQLPLYALNAEGEVGAVAFAQVRRGRMKFAGFSRKDNAVPGVKRSFNWNSLKDAWRKDVEALAVEFAGGYAPVDPKRGLNTCRRCDLQTLCRVHERLDPLTAEAEGEWDA